MKILALANQRVPFINTVNGVSTDFATIPAVTEVLLNGVSTAAVTVTVAQDATGMYAFVVDASSLAVGDEIRIVGQGSLLGRTISFDRVARVSDDSGAIVVVTPDPLAALDDGFTDGVVAAQWTQAPLTAVFSEGANGFQIDDSDTISRAGIQRAWIRTQISSYLSLSVTGDFRMTAEVALRSEDETGAPAADGYRVGGIVARGPDSGISQLNNLGAVFGVVNTGPGNGGAGLGDAPTTPGATGRSFVAFSTSSNSGQAVTDLYGDGVWSAFNITGNDRPAFSIPAGGTEIRRHVRLCRVGQNFTMLFSNDGGATWPLSETVVRSVAEMPATIEVGLSGFQAYVNPSDLTTLFRSVQFETVGGGFAGGCS